MNYLKCPNCKTLFFEVPIDYAFTCVDLFNEFFDSLPKEKQAELYQNKRAHMQDYEKCVCGTTNKDFIVDIEQVKKTRLQLLSSKSAFPTLRRG